MTLSPLNLQVALQRRVLDRVGDASGMDGAMFTRGAVAATAVTGLLRPAGAFATTNPKGGSGAACLAGKAAESANPIEKLIQGAAKFLTFLGLAVMILMFVYAGFLIITSGAKKDNYSKGMQAVKNAIIGGAIMLLGYATQRIMAAFLGGAGVETQGTECLPGNPT